jgi:hypothetical protein
MKLVRATIPMCPECGAELSHRQAEDMVPHDGCRVIIGNHYARPDYGYYAPDVSGVVAASKALLLCWQDGSFTEMYMSHMNTLRKELAKLEGKS